jgi:clumping factor B
MGMVSEAVVVVDLVSELDTLREKLLLSVKDRDLDSLKEPADSVTAGDSETVGVMDSDSETLSDSDKGSLCDTVSTSVAVSVSSCDRVKLSVASVGVVDRDIDAVTDSLSESDVLSETDADWETDGVKDSVGDSDAVGEVEMVYDVDSRREADGVSGAVNVGEPSECDTVADRESVAEAEPDKEEDRDGVGVFPDFETLRDRDRDMLRVTDAESDSVRDGSSVLVVDICTEVVSVD